MTDFSEAERNQIELEVRRVLAEEEIKLRTILADEATSYREFLQRQFKQVTIGITSLAAVGAGLFVWFFSDSVSKTQEQLEATVDAKIIDYRIVDSFRDRVNEIVKITATSDQTSQLISTEVRSQATLVVTSIADEIIRSAVGEELAKVEGLDLDALLQRAAIPAGAIVAYSDTGSCPEGWQPYEPASGKFILGLGAGYRMAQTGGAEFHTLTIEEMPQHAHEYRTTDNGPLHDNGSNFIGGAGRFGQVGAKPTAAMGGGRPHNNMPPFLVLRYCAKS